MKDYKSMFKDKKGTIIGVCDEGLLIFDGFFIDGDMRATYIVPVYQQDIDMRREPGDSDIELWKAEVAEDKCLIGFDEWWQEQLAASDSDPRTKCIEHPYPFKDESFCEILFWDEELRKEIEDDMEEANGIRPVTWESGGWCSPSSFSECYIVYDEELSREFDLRRAEVEEERKREEKKDSYGIAIDRRGRTGLIKLG